MYTRNVWRKGAGEKVLIIHIFVVVIFTYLCSIVGYNVAVIVPYFNLFLLNVFCYETKAQ